MNLIPHGFTVLVEPDAPPERSDSNLIVLPQDHGYIATSGVVVAVGKGSKRLCDERRKAYRKALAACDLSSYESDIHVWERIKVLHDATEPCPSVHVGDRVVFAAEAGLTVQDEGASYILLDEDRIAIVVEEEESVA
jgi:co-chaperonin GroES (HSP10)